MRLFEKCSNVDWISSFEMRLIWSLRRTVERILNVNWFNFGRWLRIEAMLRFNSLSNDIWHELSKSFFNESDRREERERHFSSLIMNSSFKSLRLCEVCLLVVAIDHEKEKKNEDFFIWTKMNKSSKVFSVYLQRFSLEKVFLCLSDRSMRFVTALSLGISFSLSLGAIPSWTSLVTKCFSMDRRRMKSLSCWKLTNWLEEDFIELFSGEKRGKSPFSRDLLDGLSSCSISQNTQTIRKRNRLALI